MSGGGWKDFIKKERQEREDGEVMRNGRGRRREGRRKDGRKEITDRDNGVSE